MSNKQLWNSVCVTDPQAVKPITGKPYKGSSPKPYWLIEQATETFGPIGIGWGVTVKSERFERLTETDVLHVAVVSVWYVQDGKRSETFDQMGGTKAAYMASKGMVVDEDAGKKSVTDGMVKCLSMIGFAGDIFGGRGDDSKYIEQAAAEWNQRKAEADPKRREWLDSRIADIRAAKTSGELKKIMATAVDMTRSQGDQAAEDELNEAFADKLTQAKPKAEA
jgi:hypothetical protein